VNPLVVWIWLGGLVLVLGTVVTAWPTVMERRVLAADLGVVRGTERA